MLAIELLRIKFPRLASMLSLAGAIVDNPRVGVALRLGEAARLHARDARSSSTRRFWDELFGDGGQDEQPDAGAARGDC